MNMLKNAKLTRRSSDLNENPNEAKYHLKVTIPKSRPATATTESNTSNKAVSRSIKLLNRIEEQAGNVGNIEKAESSKVNEALLKGLHTNSQTRCDSSRPNSYVFEHKEKQELKYGQLECKTVFQSVSKNTCSPRRAPFVELEALHKILDRLRPDDVESTTAWHSSESCCREIVLRFQNLLSEWASDEKRVEDCLAMDDTLTKCEHCGVIKCAEISRYQKSTLEWKENEDEIVAAEDEVDAQVKTPASSNVKSFGKTEIMRNSYPTVPPRCKLDFLNSRKKLPLEKINSNPIAENCSMKSPTNKKIVNHTCEKEATKNATILKSGNSDELSKTIDNTFAYDGKYFETRTRNNKQVLEKRHPLMETVKYLARGNLLAVKQDKPSQSSLCDELTNDLKPSYFRKPCSLGKSSFALHGSRDVDFHHDSNFFLCDRLKSREDDSITESPIKQEKRINSKTNTLDSSEDAASSSERNDVRLKESGMSIFSSSSAESMIRRWINSTKNVSKAKAERKGNITHEAPIVSSSLHNVQSIRARIADAIQKFSNRSDNFLRSNPNFSIDKNCPNDESIIKPAGKSEKTDDCQRKISMDMRSSSALSVMSSRHFEHQELLPVESSERFERQILYDQVSPRDTISEDSLTATSSKVLLMYRKILESNEEMDWESFEQLVSALHPSQRELWRDICRAVSNEAKRVADETGATTEVCVEINPLPCKSEKQFVCSRGNEITFELDMVVMKDVHELLTKNDRPAVSKEANKKKQQSLESRRK